jgi:hypothetical protein
MNSIFDKIYIDDDRNPAPLPPLQEAMKYQYEEKQTKAIDSSKMLPLFRMNAEMFYPTRQENIDSTPTVKVMAMEEVALAVIGQIIDPQKALLDYVQLMASLAGGRRRKQSIWRPKVNTQQMIPLKVHLHN